MAGYAGAMTMNHERLLEHLATQYAALRDALLVAGPDARIPTCPDWNSAALFRHLGRVYAWIQPQLGSAEGTPDIAAMPKAPEDFAELVSWTGDHLASLLHALERHGADAPTLPLAPGMRNTAGNWARRMAHETAIHRLDAEHTRAGSADVGAVPGLVFEPRFAADGIDELLTFLLPIPHPAKSALTASGTVLAHAADAGRAWLVRLIPGQPPETGVVEGTAEADVTVVGTADAVFRALWKRPSTAVLGGDVALLASVPTP